MIIKCKMCGGDLHPENESTTCECEFCGTVQTVPTDDGEKKTNLFNRANRLRMNAEFDKAAAVYESIAAEFPEEAEAYWGLCLCAYGIEYVDDPGTGEKKPTCHRTLPTSIMEDGNFEQACDNADVIARRIYREEAKAIDRIQRDILRIVSSEEPYNVFICYKETAEEGGRTEDSVLAQEIYDALTEKGLKVFFSRITLEDKLGQQYEPYIYAALSSARVMLAVGTRFEYYDAVWVKNEWMRFLSMMKTEKNKALIPCYKGLDAYDMPKEFKNLQAQDMAKIGWKQDLVRGVMKLCGKTANANSRTPLQRPVAQTGAPTVDTLLQRAFIFLEEENWDEAHQYLERVLDMDPMNPKAYIGKMLESFRAKQAGELIGGNKPLDDNTYYRKAVQYIGGRPEYKEAVDEMIRVNTLICNKISLLAAVEKRNAEQVRTLLDNGADPDSERIFEDGRHYSALRDSIVEWPDDEIANLLIDHGANVNYISQGENQFRCPVLNAAVCKKNVSIVRRLLEKGADPDSERIFADGKRYSALRDSIAEWPDDEIANMLIDAGANVNYISQGEDQFRCPVLSSAVYMGNVAIVKRLLEKGANPDCERIFDDGRQYSALRDSIAEWPDEEITNLLIDAGADVNYVEHGDLDFRSPVLNSAVYSGNARIVKKLLAKGADPDSERIFADGKRYSALRDSIAEWPNDEIANILIDAGANVNYVALGESKFRCPVLNSAICQGNTGIIRRLLEKGADPDSERFFGDGRHFSALRDSIAEWPDNGIAALLIDAGANVDYVEQNASFRCPVLITAIAKGNVAVVNMLLKKGANPNCEQVFKNGAKYSALRNSIIIWPNRQIARMLSDAGAKGQYMSTYADGRHASILAEIFREQKGELMKKSMKEKLEFVDILLDAGADFLEEDDDVRRMRIDDRYGAPREIFKKMKQAGWRPPMFG